MVKIVVCPKASSLRHLCASPISDVPRQNDGLDKLLPYLHAMRFLIVQSLVLQGNSQQLMLRFYQYSKHKEKHAQAELC